MSEYATEIKERLDLGRERFADAESRNKERRQKSNNKLMEKHDRIDSQVSERNSRMSDKSIYHHIENESRFKLWIGKTKCNEMTSKLQMTIIHILNWSFRLLITIWFMQVWIFAKYYLVLSFSQLKWKYFTPNLSHLTNNQNNNFICFFGEIVSMLWNGTPQAINKG